MIDTDQLEKFVEISNRKSIFAIFNTPIYHEVSA